jgi:hypothetical protein
MAHRRTECCTVCQYKLHEKLVKSQPHSLRRSLLKMQTASLLAVDEIKVDTCLKCSKQLWGARFLLKLIVGSMPRVQPEGSVHARKSPPPVPIHELDESSLLPFYQWGTPNVCKLLIEILSLPFENVTESWNVHWSTAESEAKFQFRPIHLSIVRFQVLKAANMNMAVSWVVLPCCLVEDYQLFTDSCSLIHWWWRQ